MKVGKAKPPTFPATERTSDPASSSWIGATSNGCRVQRVEHLVNDPYRILGVSRDTAPDDIKRAFRKLALRYHPDRNPDDPIAETRFKEVTQAYELLSDPVRRFQFDRFGHVYSRGKTPSFDADANDLKELFDRLMNEAFGSNPFRNLGGRTNNGEDLRYNISVSLADVSGGTNREISYDRLTPCDRCRGVGTDARAGRVVCPDCGGTGEARKRGILRIGNRCRRCRGQGYVGSDDCSACGGEGRISRESRVRVKIPAGVESGQRLKVREMGHVGPRGGPPGNLFVVVDVEEHPYFQRDERHLYCRLPVRFTDLALGSEVPVPTLEGQAVIRIPPGTQPDQVLTLRGQGLPGPRGGKAGEQRVRLVLEVPRELDAASRRALHAAADAADPGVTELRKQVLDLLDEMG